MTQTARRIAPNFLGPEFNRFLFAMVGTDRQGGQLSVISALARLDLDAWAEAAALARLPRDAAVQKLSGMLRKYPEIPQITQEAPTIAARLIALLPGGAPVGKAAKAAPSRWSASNGAAALGMLIALGVMIGLQCASQAANRHAAAVTPVVQSSTGQPPAPKLP